MDYDAFLAAKQVEVPAAGFDVAANQLNPALFPWQRDIVRWALKRGRAAIFAECGLGKTLMQLEWSRHIGIVTDMPVLILAPLAVAEQTAREGAKFGIPVTICASGADVQPGVNVTNYEKLHLFDVSVFGGVVLDESSILKNYMGKIKQSLIVSFVDTPFKLCCTATPAPNEYVELGNHAEFLNVMIAGDMLTRWFMHDTQKGRSLHLKAHGEDDFWRWVSSWAACVSKPSDLLDQDGQRYSDDGYKLPPLEIIEHTVAVDHTIGDGEHLFRLPILSATEMHREMRLTIEARAFKAAEIVLASEEPCIIWCHTDYEADAMIALLPGAVEIRGKHSDADKHRKLAAFSSGEVPYIISKPSICGFGLNWQHCRRVVFVGRNYSFEKEYQALRRSWRFGQERSVEAHLIAAETEGAIGAAIERKQREHAKMQEKMVAAMQETMLEEREDLRVIAGPGIVRMEHGDGWDMYLGDCVEVTQKLPSESMGFSIFSPPFSTLYTYSPSLRDMGNCADDEHFFEHFGYLIPELWRVMIPGRLVAVHVKNLPIYKSHEGYSGIRDFRGDVIRAFTEAQIDGGCWALHSEVTIWTDPVQEMQRTKAQGLLYSQLRRDASYSRQGMAEYLVVFRKWTPECATVPVTHNAADLPLDLWQKFASPVWMDINRMNVLNVDVARDNKDEKHLCPLQLDVIERAVTLWSNPGDVVFSPFAGIGSEGRALKLRRQFCGVELKEGYFNVALKNLAMEALKRDQPTMFDIFDLQAGAA